MRKPGRRAHDPDRFLGACDAWAPYRVARKHERPAAPPEAAGRKSCMNFHGASCTRYRQATQASDRAICAHLCVYLHRFSESDSRNLLMYERTTR